MILSINSAASKVVISNCDQDRIKKAGDEPAGLASQNEK